MSGVRVSSAPFFGPTNTRTDASGPHPERWTALADDRGSIGAVGTHAAGTPHTGGLLAFVTIVLTLLSWASVPLFLRSFRGDIDPFTANGWRYALSALIWLPVIVVAWRKGTLGRTIWKDALVPTAFNVVAQVFFGIAPYLIDPGLMTFGLRLQIVFAVAGAAVLIPAERELLRTPKMIAAIACVFVGTMGTILLGEKSLDVSSGRHVAGVVMSIAAGGLYAAYSLGVRRRLSHYHSLLAFSVVSQYTAVAMIATLLVAMGVGAAGVIPQGVAAGLLPRDPIGSVLAMPTREFILLIISAVVGIGVGHSLYYYSIKRIGVAVSAGVIQLQPILVSIASMRLFGESFTLLQWIFGGFAVVSAIVMLVIQSRFSKRRHVVVPVSPGALAPVVPEVEDEEPVSR